MFRFWDNISLVGGGGALRVKISRGVPLEVQNGTQQDQNKTIDLLNLGGNKIVYILKMGGGGGFWNETQQDLNKMVDMVKFWGAKRSSRCLKWGGGQNRGAYLLTLKEDLLILKNRYRFSMEMVILIFKGLIKSWGCCSHNSRPTMISPGHNSARSASVHPIFF